MEGRGKLPERSDLERELIQDLVNQGYEFADMNTPKPCWPMCACSCRH
jgi:hypothetical protein